MSARDATRVLALTVLLMVAGCRGKLPREVVMTMGNDLEQAGNRLRHANSPYLLQHAHNPVDWYPWGPEAFQRAKEENKPIFLSIGYAACHWCHVMERESFENKEIASILNTHFVSIKVDREEHPEVDAIYMDAVQAMTGQGGWPLSVFLTPDLKPFFGGTYFPPDSRFGRPGFRQLLTSLAEAWAAEQTQIVDMAHRLTEELSRRQLAGSQSNTDGSIGLTMKPLQNVIKSLGITFDTQWGGFGDAPKFPPSATLRLLLREYKRTGAPEVLSMVTCTLDRMAQGGFYDHLGGGFHRYTVDREWLVPHFEKMLYDNAALSRAYLEAYQVTGNQAYGQIVSNVLDYVIREMTDPVGAFHASEDADSEGHEGKFYVWSKTEILQRLGREDGEAFSDYYGVTTNGNFEGKNILHRPLREDDPSPADAKFLEKLPVLRQTLFVSRSKRVRPGKDDKILASWNGMMISSFAHAYRVLREPRFLAAAEKAGRFILKEMMRDGELLHSYRAGKVDFHGTLEDYAFVASAMLDLYEATFDVVWFEAAVGLTDSVIELFGDPDGPGFFFTSVRHENLLMRRKDFRDGSIPSANAVATELVLRLSLLTGRVEWREKAERILAHTLLGERGAMTWHAQMLLALDFVVSDPVELAVVGRSGDPDTEAFLAALDRTFLPAKVLAFIDPELADSRRLARLIPLLADRETLGGRPTLYICRDFSCRKPMTDLTEIARVLKSP